MLNTEFADRRIFQRIPVKLPLRFFDLNSSKEGLVQTQDISANGIGLLTDEEFLPYTPLEMWLQIPDKGEPLYASGDVVWSEMVEPNKYRVGVSFGKTNLMGISRLLRAIRPKNNINTI